MSSRNVLTVDQIRHLNEILSDEKSKIIPAVNQIDLHPFMTRVELVKFCESKNIALQVCYINLPMISANMHHQAWGPLVRGMRFNHPVLMRIAEAKNKTTAQILLRWGFQMVIFSPIICGLTADGQTPRTLASFQNQYHRIG